MSEIDSYKLKDNETEIILSKDGPNWIVDQFDKDGNARWNRLFRNEEDARKEFNRWRNY
jgi:hypothetical protein